MRIVTHILFALLLAGCGGQRETREHPEVTVPVSQAKISPSMVVAEASNTVTTVHVFVALCDNKSQGIVPVPEVLGNGDDPRNNLYWGAMYGTKSFLKKSKAWIYVREEEISDNNIIERIVFKHAAKDVYLVADAYRGTAIKMAVTDFLRAAGGNDALTLKAEEEILGLNGNADLVVYVGHNGLMDIDVAPQKRAAQGSQKHAMILACKSEPYFHARLTALGSKSVLLTTGLMAPEAYTLDAAVRAWIAGESNETIRERAAVAYNKYQKCGMTGARRLFYSEPE
jgi:hypothetical protein